MDSGRKPVLIHCPAHSGSSSRMESQMTLRVFKTNEATLNQLNWTTVLTPKYLRHGARSSL